MNAFQVDGHSLAIPKTEFTANIPFTVQDLSVQEMIGESISNNEAILSDEQALVVDTGEFTGRSPKDRFIVRDEVTEMDVNWNDINQPINTEHFDQLFEKMKLRMLDMRIYRRHASVCANPAYKLNLDIYTEHAFLDLFVHNLFLPPSNFAPVSATTRWTIIALPSFMANPADDGTRQGNFSILNFSRKIILIGGTAYTGEIKKAVFSVLNFLLPAKNVLPMHCAINQGEDGKSALFFGLSGTGKTSLSADSSRKLIGDDEHGWGPGALFNIEGGCYAKCIGLEREKEPQIFKAIKYGTLVENTRFLPDSKRIDFFNASKTENTRAAYPLSFIDNALIPSITGDPSTIFFLTADAFGVLPPISRLSNEQAVYYFLSGYTAKVAGTETGVQSPEATFSACFGKAFLTRHPGVYAKMLEKKLKLVKPEVWLINTGWSGGAFGIGNRIPIKETRAMITAVLSGKLENVTFTLSKGFNLSVPDSVPGVNSDYLNPRQTWVDVNAYDKQLEMLIGLFQDNFSVYQAFVGPEVLNAGPSM